MYCMKVEPGRERIKVRQVASGFLPSYRQAGENGKTEEGKRLVVPGYVFMLQYTPGALQVPEDEWKIIEAISDPAPSVLDYLNKKITEGPLKAVEEKITSFEENWIRVYVNLLGENRWYRLAVVTCEPETEDTEEETAVSDGTTAEIGNGADGSDGADTGAGRVDGNSEGADTEPGNAAGHPDGTGTAKKGEGKDMSEVTRSGFTAQQEARMIARAEEIGTKEAAEEFGVNWQVIAGMKRRARARGEETVATEEKKAGEALKMETAGKNGAETAVSETEAPGDTEGLKVENAILREKVGKLEAQVEKLRKALQELI